MMKKDVQIIPPGHMARSSQSVPTLVHTGRIESTLDRWRYDYQAKSVSALARLNGAEAECRRQQTNLVEADTKLTEALLRRQELPEKWGHELQVRRIDRARELDQHLHAYEIQSIRNAKERTNEETELTKSREAYVRADTALIDAKQQRSAQIKHGELHYEIAHAEANLKRLDIDLSKRERKALMKKQLQEIEDRNFERELAEDLEKIMQK
jgi:multidrug resistance efflux pump